MLNCQLKQNLVHLPIRVTTPQNVGVRVKETFPNREIISFRAIWELTKQYLKIIYEIVDVFAPKCLGAGIQVAVISESLQRGICTNFLPS